MGNEMMKVVAMMSLDPEIEPTLSRIFEATKDLRPQVVCFTCLTIAITIARQTGLEDEDLKEVVAVMMKIAPAERVAAIREGMRADMDAIADILKPRPVKS